MASETDCISKLQVAPPVPTPPPQQSIPAPLEAIRLLVQSIQQGLSGGATPPNPQVQGIPAQQAPPQGAGSVLSSPSPILPEDPPPLPPSEGSPNEMEINGPPPAPTPELQNQGGAYPPADGVPGGTAVPAWAARLKGLPQSAPQCLPQNLLHGNVYQGNHSQPQLLQNGGQAVQAYQGYQGGVAAWDSAVGLVGGVSATNPTEHPTAAQQSAAMGGWGQSYAPQLPQTSPGEQGHCASQVQQSGGQVYSCLLSALKS